MVQGKQASLGEGGRFGGELSCMLLSFLPTHTQPAELWTKLGAVGHIKEPVGTHGLMKVRFNRVINQSDTICLALFKRVYPKILHEQQEQPEEKNDA